MTSVIRAPHRNSMTVFKNNIIERRVAESIAANQAAKEKKKEAAVVDQGSIDYLHRAAGKHGFNLSGVTLERIQKWVGAEISTVEGMLTAYVKEGGVLEAIPIHNFILAFDFPDITTGNVKEYATGIYRYIADENESFLSQLKGKRKQKFLSSRDRINDARGVLSSFSETFYY